MLLFSYEVEFSEIKLRKSWKGRYVLFRWNFSMSNSNLSNEKMSHDTLHTFIDQTVKMWKC
jgi:hypothetical protein